MIQTVFLSNATSPKYCPTWICQVSVFGFAVNCVAFTRRVQHAAKTNVFPKRAGTP